MKLHSFLLPTLAGIAVARVEEQPQHAETYIITQAETTTTSSNPPSIPNDLARAILLQRLSTPDKPSALGRLPESLADTDAVSYIKQFGKQPRPLFEDAASESSQLVITFSGITADNYDSLRAALSPLPVSFTVPGLSRLPTSLWNQKKRSCAFASSINPEDGKCWKGQTQYLAYDAVKDSSVIAELGKNLDALRARARDGKLETTIVLLAPAGAAPEELRRRDGFESEEVIAVKDADGARAASGPGAGTTFVSDSKPLHAFASRPPPVFPACFASHNACVTATDSCSGHGECVNWWAKRGAAKRDGDGDGDGDACFACHCLATPHGPNNVQRWGGGACHKRDVSTPFWLFVGVATVLGATVAFAVGLLFSVGEQKLPGVIGAGVSRSK
ncbi:hypothetical protein GGS23DRAFT_603277 [Durotheca rogersii]|uniref:uncharacterized protein n=1 Tax=Durotheca rogersii TaxID=419775 RepID=UPI00221E9F47|nr:uncharacterized protein GGS23DRAFT_603277 [Durotheca rogersii]KAI5865749.1 hypothetical protein GGS23DRAFT_603277 [Durotheca rogersii]